MALTHAERVSNGIQYLRDAHRGKLVWLDAIDLDDFSIARSDKCIIGQVFGSYWDWVRIHEFDHSQQADLGFESKFVDCGSELDLDADYRKLQDEWITQITQLRATRMGN